MEFLKNIQTFADTAKMNVAANSRVMQALEKLTESQVNDFLSGKAPLLLAMKLGEHMMFVQLQLSTSCQARRRSQQHLSSPSHHHNPSHPNNNNTTTEQSQCSCSPPTSPTAPTTDPNSGAVIDSVNHLGQGVYSGTFSGTLDQSIQDPTGRPKRNINTILQILNDLLVASPQLRESTTSLRESTTSLRESTTSLRESSTPTSLHESVNARSPPAHTSPLTELSMRGNKCSSDGERLRGKVQSLQKMMQERKQRRQEKRGLKAPYQWPNRSNFHQRMRSAQRVNYESSLSRDLDVTGTGDSMPSTEAAAAAFASATSMEHESVLV